MQPTIQKIFKSRQIEESLLVWINGKDLLPNYYEYLKANATTILNGTSFNQALYNGFNAGNITGTLSYTGGDAAKAVSELQGFKASNLELVLIPLLQWETVLKPITLGYKSYQIHYENGLG